MECVMKTINNSEGGIFVISGCNVTTLRRWFSVCACNFVSLVSSKMDVNKEEKSWSISSEQNGQQDFLTSSGWRRNVWELALQLPGLNLVEEWTHRVDPDRRKASRAWLTLTENPTVHVSEFHVLWSDKFVHVRLQSVNERKNHCIIMCTCSNPLRGRISRTEVPSFSSLSSNF